MVIKKGIAKKKRWITIHAPAMFERVVVGETYLTEPEEAIGRYVSLNIGNFGEQQKNQLNAKMKIVSVNNSLLETELTSLYYLPSAMRKFVRRGKEKMETSMTVKTKNNQFLRIKTLIVTRNRCTGGILRALHHKLLSLLIKIAQENDALDMLKGVVQRKLQRDIQDGLRKIYPIAICEIRHIEIIPEPKHGVTKIAVKEKEETVEELPAEETQEHLPQTAPTVPVTQELLPEQAVKSVAQE